MASETVCKACGSTAGVEYRERCDGCGGLVGNRYEVRSQGMTLPAVANTFSLCEACQFKVRAMLSPALLACGRCGHFRPEHNSSCIREGCQCGGWVKNGTQPEGT